MYNWLLLRDNGETFYELPRLTQNFPIKEKENSLLNIDYFIMNKWILFQVYFKSSNSSFSSNEILLGNLFKQITCYD